MYYVESRFFDNGKVKSRILTEEQGKALNYDNHTPQHMKACDIYIDKCDTMEQASALVKRAI